MSATETETKLGAEQEWDEQGVEGVDPDEAVPPMQIPIPGVIERMSLSAGGQQPTSSEARLLGASIPIEGQFENGSLVTLVIECRVQNVMFPNTLGKYGDVEKTTRRHLLRPISITRAAESE
jgi:hypothetical protein